MQTRTLKRSRRRIIYSSDEEPFSICRQDEVPPAESPSEPVPRRSTRNTVKHGKDSSVAKRDRSKVAPSQIPKQRETGSSSPVVHYAVASTSQAVIHYEDARHRQSPSHPSQTADGVSQNHEGITPQKGLAIYQDEVVITLDHDDNGSPWDSDEESGSDTSTPAYKRGKVEQPPSPPARKIKRRSLEERAITRIQRDGIRLERVPAWMRKQRGPTTILLCDSYFRQWPLEDKKVVIIHQPAYDLWRWNTAIRSGEIDLQYFNVIICLQRLAKLDGLNRLKNTILALSRSVKAINQDCRLFFTNLPPNPHSSPLQGKRIPAINHQIKEAVEAVVRSRVIKVHFLSIYEHLADNNGTVIHPVQQFFKGEFEMTKFGCSMVREVVMREAGFKTVLVLTFL